MLYHIFYMLDTIDTTLPRAAVVRGMEKLPSGILHFKEFRSSSPRIVKNVQVIRLATSLKFGQQPW